MIKITKDVNVMSKYPEALVSHLLLHRCKLGISANSQIFELNKCRMVKWKGMHKLFIKYARSDNWSIVYTWAFQNKIITRQRLVHWPRDQREAMQLIPIVVVCFIEVSPFTYGPLTNGQPFPCYFVSRSFALPNSLSLANLIRCTSRFVNCLVLSWEISSFTRYSMIQFNRPQKVYGGLSQVSRYVQICIVLLLFTRTFQPTVIKRPMRHHRPLIHSAPIHDPVVFWARRFSKHLHIYTPFIYFKSLQSILDMETFCERHQYQKSVCFEPMPRHCPKNMGR